MAENSPVNQADAGHEVRTYFVRGHNALAARAAFGELYVDYFLHNGEQRIDVAEAHAELFKRALAGFVLHCASRPWNEMTAWTLHFQEPLLNIFLTGDNGTGAVTGRVFAEGVREMESNLFYADVVRPRQPKRRSTTGFAGGDPLAAMEAFVAEMNARKKDDDNRGGREEREGEK